MIKQNTPYKPILLNIPIVFLFFLIQYNSVFSIKIGGANPMLMLSVCLAFSMFSGELGAVIFALVIGMITDGAAATPICFNTVSFIILSLAVSFTVKYLFNNNIRSAVLLSVLSSVIYYAVRFSVCVPKQTLESTVGFSLRYILPSVIYTAVIMIPLYFYEKKVFGKYFVR